MEVISLTDLRKDIFQKYKKIHDDFVDNDALNYQERLEWFRHLFMKNYRDCFKNPESRVLEIGCNKGYFLSILRDNGFNKLFGIDLSPDDIAEARKRFQLENVVVADAFEFLSKHSKGKAKTFDIIFAKDVLEHIPKHQLNEFLSKIKTALSSNGTVIFQVPNMDWIMSPHERYMDLTHEVGFNKESLGQLMRLHFQNVEIKKVHYVFPKTWKQKMLFGFFRTAYLRLYRFHLKIFSEGAGEVWFESREIMAIGKNL
ncbi:MAG: class I SAM-dependent methyltransferase [Bacteroidota bacterium]|nr:class I SAM-dependent methyltransferase [Bacteroidota bacterium]